MIIGDLPKATATQTLGLRLGQSLQAGSILLLEGDLGAGKTSLVQSIGLGLGITDPIVSPTFTLINEYHEGRLPLYHLDLYRLQSDQIPSLHLENYWEGIEVPLGIVAVEWSERLLNLPDRYLKIHLSYKDEGRQATLTPCGNFNVNTDILENL